jgi:hypothetical protein
MSQRQISYFNGKFWLKNGCKRVRIVGLNQFQSGDIVTEQDGSITQVNAVGQRCQIQPSPNPRRVPRTALKGGRTTGFK